MKIVWLVYIRFLPKKNIYIRMYVTGVGSDLGPTVLQDG